MELGILLTISIAAAGGMAAFVGMTRMRRPVLDAGEYLRELDSDPGIADEFEAKLAEPFFVRVVRPVSGSLVGLVSRLTPRHYLETTHHKLLLAGLTGTMRAEEFVVAQVAGTGLLTVAALAYVTLAEPAFRTALLVVILAPTIGILFPPSWLSRKVRERQQAILKDLPDTLDLLAISVEAGMGFE
ncbi:MAG: hypothetical protein M3163_16320, partial [Actinomycetota bacterium]|nr:hypothetical protein [Actinomycetota bacterium]